MDRPKEKGPPVGKEVADDFSDMDIPMEGDEEETDEIFDDNDQDKEYVCYLCKEVLYGAQEIEEHQKEHPPLRPVPRTLQDSRGAEASFSRVVDDGPDGRRTAYFIRQRSSRDEEEEESLGPGGRRRSSNTGSYGLAPTSRLSLVDEVDANPDGQDLVKIAHNSSLQATPVRSHPGEVIGIIQWPELDNKLSKFIRISVQANIGDTCHFLRNTWKLPQANLNLYFIDVEDNKLQDCEGLVKDLHSLSEKISILMTTMGQCKINPTLAQMVHKVKERIGSKPQGLCSIAMPSWRLLDEGTQRLFRQISKSSETEERSGGQGVEDNLGKAHDYYLMADDDREDIPTESVLPGIIKFRQRLEGKLMLKGETKLPAVYLLAGGAEKSWDYMMSALKKKIPVIVIVDSGGLADKLFKLRQAGQLVEGTTVDDDGMTQQSLELVNVPADVQEEFKNYTDERELKVLLKTFNYIQFYDIKSNEDLEDVLCQTFIQARQDEQLARLLRKSHVTVTRMQQLDLGLHQSVILTPGSVAAVGNVGVKHSDPAMMLMLQALMNNCPESVRIFLDQGLDFEADFKQHHLAMLYAKVKDSSPLYKLAKKAGKKIEEGKEFTITDSRLVVHYLLLGCTYPLHCGSGKDPDECDYCSKTLSDVQNALKSVELKQPVSGAQNCCMEPSQELFLWAVLMGRGELAELFWEQRPERTSSALIACALFSTMAESVGEGDDYRTMSAFAERFQNAAKGTLETAYKVDEFKTHKVLSEMSQYWGKTCIIDLAYDLGSMEVVALRTFSAKLDSVWRGGVDEDIGIMKILLCLFCPCFIPRLIEMEDAEMERSAGDQENAETTFSTPCQLVEKFYTSPRVKFILSQMSFVAFLILYAYVILFQVTPQRFTPAEIVLCVWVFTFCIEEGRQICSRGGLKMWDKVKTYLKDEWNRIDFGSIAFFIIGLTLRFFGQKQWVLQNSSPDNVTEDMSEVFQWAHICLSLDFILFLARLVQIFCMHQILGPMITMVFRMMKDLVNFMVILILACLAYAVTSHAILYPNGQTQFTGAELFKIPAQAYWTVFGDLGTVDTLKAQPVENGEETCSFNRSVVAQGDLPACPSNISRYLVPILLGFYLMVANVLLLNLLIAIFGNTYSNVKERALVYWRWQRCVVTIEFKNRWPLPPPFNVLWLPYLLLHCLSGGKCSPCSTGRRRGRERNQGDDAQVLLNVMGERKKQDVHTLFAWERKMSDEFIRVRKKREEDNIVEAINGLSSGQGAMEATLKALEREFTVVRRLAARQDKQEEALQKVGKTLDNVLSILKNIDQTLASQKAHRDKFVKT